VIDAHIHLDFIVNGEEVASDAETVGARLLSATVTPSGFRMAQSRFSAFGNVTVGLGLHPWWVEHASDADLLLELLDEVTLVSEVGLDFGKRHRTTHDEQLRAFTRIARACAEAGGKTLSIHSVHAASETLDVLEKTGVLDSCACIFHWFTGPSDQLKRAREAGCWFSVGERMLVTGKGREYVKAISADRLLLETDAPPEQGQAYSFVELQASLNRVSRGVARIKGAAYSDEPSYAALMNRAVSARSARSSSASFAGCLQHFICRDR